MGILYAAIIGIAAGWLAGVILKGKGFGILGNLVIGLLGGIVGAVIFGVLGLAATNRLGQLIASTGGAVALLAIVNAVSKRR